MMSIVPLPLSVLDYLKLDIKRHKQQDFRTFNKERKQFKLSNL